MVLESTQRSLSELIGQCALGSSENALLGKRKLSTELLTKECFKHSLLLDKMQSVFPFCHFCVDNNKLTMENVQAYCVFTGGRGELWTPS